jgi:hypothetical protein
METKKLPTSNGGGGNITLALMLWSTMKKAGFQPAFIKL